MIEFLVQRTDGDWFDLPANSDPYRPITIAYQPLGDDGGRLLIAGCEVSFSSEDPGIQISFHGDISEHLADQVAREVLERVQSITGQKGQLLRLS